MTRNIPTALQKVIPPEALSLVTTDGSDIVPTAVSYEYSLRRWFDNTFSPFGYQSTVIEELFVRAKNSATKGMLCLPTGAGKTVTACELLLRILSSGFGDEQTVVWIAPQKELLIQAATTLHNLWHTGSGPPSLEIKVLKSQSDTLPSSSCRILLGTPQTTHRVLSKHRGLTITALVFDEAHHLAASTYADVWRSLSDVTYEPRLCLGLSATPVRQDLESQDELCDLLAHTLFIPDELMPSPIESLQDLGVLSRPSSNLIPNAPVSMLDTGVSTDTIELNPSYWMAVVETVSALPGSSLVYCHNRNTGQLLTQHLRHIGCSAEYIDGDDSLSIRLSALERFRDGKSRILVNVNLLLEGVDMPNADNCLMTYTIKSPVRFSQVVGRVLRGAAVGGKGSASVWVPDRISQRRVDAVTSFDLSGLNDWHNVEHLKAKEDV